MIGCAIKRETENSCLRLWTEPSLSICVRIVQAVAHLTTTLMVGGSRPTLDTSSYVHPALMGTGL